MTEIKPGQIGVVQKRLLLSNDVELLPQQSFFVLAVSEKQQGYILEVNEILCLVPFSKADALSFI